MASTITKLLLIAFYVATWASSLPTMAGEVSSCGRDDETHAASIYLDCSGLSSDAITNSNANANANANDNTDPSMLEICFPDKSCCGTAENCPQAGRCFDEGRCSDSSGCDVPGRSASTTSSFTCPPMQTCATSLVAAVGSADILTFACFDIRTRIAEIVAPSVASVTPIPKLKSIPVLELPDTAPDSAPSKALTWLIMSTQIWDSNSPFETTAVESFLSNSAEYAPFATDTPLSSSAEPIATVISDVQDTSIPASTWTTRIQTNVQAIPTRASMTSTPGAQSPNRTSIIVGGLFGSLSFIAISITLVDYLIKRRRYNRCRHSISDTSTNNDAIAHNKKEQQQMTAYGYYGTNRAGIITKGSGVFEANSAPVELPAETAAEHRE